MMAQSPNIPGLVEHLFRQESGKLISVLTRVLGSSRIQLAEDVVQEALAEAIRQWAYTGVPENPAGWLYRVAKFQALNIIRREKIHQKYVVESAANPTAESEEEWMARLFSEKEIADDQLRMMFICCHPAISRDSQVALILKTLCGFSISEIAAAFLSGEDTINKRLVRARQTIRDNRISFDLPSGTDYDSRLGSVLEAIYLLFNEGYNSSHGDNPIRADLCAEAIRLLVLLSNHPKDAGKDRIHALLALMLLNASRFKSRLDEYGELVELPGQDRSLWDRGMIESGLAYLQKSMQNNTVSSYQILAAISAHHCTADSDETTNWAGILELYDYLSGLDNSPLVHLNKAIAFSRVMGYAPAIQVLESYENDPVLNKYAHYYSTLAGFYMKIADHEKAIRYFEKSLSLSHNEKERAYLKRQILFCRSIDQGYQKK